MLRGAGSQTSRATDVSFVPFMTQGGGYPFQLRKRVLNTAAQCEL